MGRAMQLQEQQIMQEREREYNKALDQCMDQDRLQVTVALPPAAYIFLQLSCNSTG